jgi:hypothetical protein
MKKSVRKVHINEEEWKYTVQGDSHGDISSVTIFNPFRVRHTIKAEDFFGRKLDTHGGEQVTPAMVKKYIQKNLFKGDL